MRELTYVTPNRQEEIFVAMENYKDYTLPFVRSLVLKTPPPARTKNRTGVKNPWARTEQRKSNLLKKLATTEEKHDFYTTLYRQYSVNLLKLVIYARTLVNNDRIAAYLRVSHPANPGDLPGHRYKRRRVGDEVPVGQFRDRESVIRAVLQREREGRPLNPAAVKLEIRSLYRAGFRHFGSCAMPWPRLESILSAPTRNGTESSWWRQSSCERCVVNPWAAGRYVHIP